MELILTERSDGSYGAPALHGMLTASVVGPEPVPTDWILQTVLSPPESEEIGFDNFPEFSWAVEKTEELLLRIGRVFQQDPEMFRLLVYMPKLKEGDTTSDPRTWCNGFVEDGVQSRKLGADLCDEVFREDRTDPNDFRSGRMGKKGCLNPFTELIPLELCDGLKIAALAIHAFWSSYDPNRGGFRHRWPLTPQSQLFKFAPEPELTENRVRTVILGHAA